MGGVRIDFREPVHAMRMRIPLYVTVDGLEGFATALEARGLPGVDARKRR